MILVVATAVPLELLPAEIGIAVVTIEIQLVVQQPRP